MQIFTTWVELHETSAVAHHKNVVAGLCRCGQCCLMSTAVKGMEAPGETRSISLEPPGPNSFHCVLCPLAAASSHCLQASQLHTPCCSLVLPFFFRSPFQFDFRPLFGPISDPKSTSKSIKNRSEMSSKIKLQTSLISASSSIKFRRQSHVQAKWSMFKNRSKTLCFCMFFRHPLMPIKANTRHATHSNIIKNHIQNQ